MERQAVRMAVHQAEGIRSRAKGDGGTSLAVMEADVLWSNGSCVCLSESVCLSQVCVCLSV